MILKVMQLPKSLNLYNDIFTYTCNVSGYGDEEAFVHQDRGEDSETGDYLECGWWDLEVMCDGSVHGGGLFGEECALLCRYCCKHEATQPNGNEL